MQELNNTQYFKVEAEKDLDVRDVIAAVYMKHYPKKDTIRLIRLLGI